MDKSLAMLLACLLVFTLLIAVDATSVILSISSITADLHGDATESFWIGSSYLLAMCISQPLMASMSNIFGRKSTILAATTLLAIGSLLSEDSESMALLLTGRTIQGLGAGGLTVLSYMTYGELEKIEGDRFLAAMSFSIALGTVCGPLVGSVLSDGSNWRWLFRLNIPSCIVLGVIIYNTNDAIYKQNLGSASLADLDVISAMLSITSVVPLLVGLSLAGSLYEWTDWRTIAPIAFGGVCLILFAVRELQLLRSWPSEQSFRHGAKPFLGLRYLRSIQAISICVGAVLLGVLTYALLFFLPIYYRVIQGHSSFAAGLLLLSQTLMIAPCGVTVWMLVEMMKWEPGWIILFGWACTSSGFGLLAMLDADKTLSAEILLNLPTGLGIGVLLPVLALSAKDKKHSTDVQQTSMVVIYLRYWGSAVGLVVTSLLFQRGLRQNLAGTKFQGQAAELTKHATTLMYSIRQMSQSQDKAILVQATQETLCTIWIALCVASAAVFLLNCITAIVGGSEKTLNKPDGHVEAVDATPTFPLEVQIDIDEFADASWDGRFGPTTPEKEFTT